MKERKQAGLPQTAAAAKSFYKQQSTYKPSTADDIVENAGRMRMSGGFSHNNLGNASVALLRRDQSFVTLPVASALELCTDKPPESILSPDAELSSDSISVVSNLQRISSRWDEPINQTAVAPAQPVAAIEYLVATVDTNLPYSTENADNGAFSVDIVDDFLPQPVANVVNAIFSDKNDVLCQLAADVGNAVASPDDIADDTLPHSAADAADVTLSYEPADNIPTQPADIDDITSSDDTTDDALSQAEADIVILASPNDIADNSLPHPTKQDTLLHLTADIADMTLVGNIVDDTLPRLTDGETHDTTLSDEGTEDNVLFQPADGDTDGTTLTHDTEDSILPQTAADATDNPTTTW